MPKAKKRTEDAPELLTALEVARVLRCKPNTCYLGSLRHALPWIKRGSNLLLRRSDLDEYLRRGQEAARTTRHAA